MSACEVRNLFLLAELFMSCAKEREESGMRTYRMDHPEKVNVPWKEALVAKLEDGDIAIQPQKAGGIEGGVLAQMKGHCRCPGCFREFLSRAV